MGAICTKGAMKPMPNLINFRAMDGRTVNIIRKRRASAAFKNGFILNQLLSFDKHFPTQIETTRRVARAGRVPHTPQAFET